MRILNAGLKTRKANFLGMVLKEKLLLKLKWKSKKIMNMIMLLSFLVMKVAKV